MPSLRDLSIKRKLVGIIVLTSSVALLMACIAFTVFDWISTKRSMVANLATLSSIIANNSVAALEFDDVRTADEMLQFLATEQHLAAAAIYRADGSVLAHYARGGQPFEAPPIGEAQARFQEDRLVCFHPVVFDDVPVGTVYLQSDLGELESRRGRYVQILTIFIITSLVVALLVAGILQSLISRPILDLVEAAQEVKEHRNYAVRVAAYGGDEIGSLMSGFNEMLDEIETRDRALQHTRDELAQRAEELQVELSERQRAEEARLRAEQELEAQQALNMRADRLRSLGEMAAGIAHELNQPLVGVRGLAEHMLLGMGRGWDLDEETARQRLTSIVDQADRMTHIIEHVRMFARESGKPEMSAVLVNDVVTSGVNLLQEQFRAHGLTIDYQLGVDLPAVSANPFSLEEVLLNLLSNARDAVEEMPHDDSGERAVCVRTGRRNGPGSRAEVLIEVVDSGGGIPAEVASRVFDPFFTTKDPDKGTGLGLAISKSIVEGFGGSLAIDSAAGRGTTVTVALPALES